MNRSGWLDRQIEQASEEIKNWPEWMKKDTELDSPRNTEIKKGSTTKNRGSQKPK